MSAVFILLVMYWGADGRSSMTSAEFTTIERCEAARKAISKEWDSSYRGFGADRAYSVCVAK